MSVFRNLTPHALNIHLDDGTVLNLATSGTVARVATSRTVRENIGAVPTFRVETGEVTDLPSPVEGMILIVSGFVASAAPREDVFSPGELVRDDSGRPVGCHGLSRSC